MFCPKCGKGINEVGRFCKWCGVEVSEFLERIRGVNDEEIKKEEPKHKVGGEERELERRRVLLMSRFKQGFNYVKERDWLICLLLFLGSFLIMYLLRADCLFHMDSVGYAMKAKLMFETLTQQYAHFTGYPGYIFIISVIYGFQKIVFNIQTAESATIFASVLFGALSVPLLYLFAKNILNKFIGIAASVFLAITPIFLSISTYGKDHTASVFFVLLSFYLLALYNKKGSNLLLALSSLCFGFSVTVRFTNLIIGLPYFLFYLDFKVKTRKFDIEIDYSRFRIKRLVWLAVPAILAFLWFYLRMFRTSRLEPILVGARYNKFLGLNPYLTTLSFEWLTKSVTLIGWIFLVVGVYYVFIKNKNYLIILAIWLVSNFIYLANNAMNAPRWFSELFIPISILVGGGVYKISSIRIKRKSLSFVSLALFVVMVVLMLNTVYPLLKFRHDYCGPKELGVFVKERTEPGSLILAVDSGSIIRYYANRTTLKHPVNQNYTNEKAWRDFKFKIDSYLNEGKQVYAISTFFSYDEQRLTQRFMAENYDVVEIGEVLTEDYHKKSIYDGRFVEALYMVRKK